MIVVDASALVELITDEGGRSRLVADELESDAAWACPEHTLIEVVSALRGLWLGGRSTEGEFHARVELLRTLQFDVYPTEPLLLRICALAANATAYDAAYLALGELLGVPVITLDAKLARVPSVTAEVCVIG